MRLFISYAKKDTRELALYLREILQAVIPGLVAWMDESLETGESWAWQIQTEIDQCDCVLVLLSPDVNRTPAPGQKRSFVLNEIDYAQQQDKTIIPIMAQPTRVPVQIAGIQYVDLAADFEVGKQKLIDQLLRRVSLPSLLTPPTVRLEAPQNTIQMPPDVSHILPLPFEWCEIPAGWVTLEDASDPKKYFEIDIDIPSGTKEGKFHVKPFWVTKYPITNAQYCVFENDEDGYLNPAWWDYSAEAKTWRNKHSVPKDTAFQGDYLPRTNVSWYEAVGFCRWLNAQIFPISGTSPLHGEGRKDTSFVITLPTEQQWQRAAQGDDGRKYPWGNEEPDKNRCNFGGNVGQPTLVMQYPHGVSPYGVYDMAGNVLEWCLNEWGTNRTELIAQGWRVLRGGLWEGTVQFARCASRLGLDASGRNNYIGFRVAVGVPVL